MLLWSPFQVLNSDFVSVMDGDDEGCAHMMFLFISVLSRWIR